ncbi:MAG: sugar phosphate isomerase/epimerase [Planctomycetota bacterium]|jgi:sugar phosphate isomerase/epimerase|nr:MAG: sugar phosphate isomerase/epimerase [Planctomycetota bacterium]
MRPAVATVCSLDAALETVLEDYAAGHCDAVDLWLGHAEAFLETHEPAALAALLARHGIAAVAASFQGGLLTSQGEARREHWAHFEKRLALCRDLGIPVLVVSGDAFGPLGPQDLGRLSGSLAEAARRGADAGVRLALEFDSRASFPNNLQSALALVEDVGSPALGVCLDWFHFTVGPSKPLDLRLLSNETLAHVQLSDIADVPREMASDSDRILPGEGSSPPDDLLRRLGEIGYTGAVGVELHNPQLWRVPPRQFGEIAITALRRLLGQAGMGDPA